MPTTQREKFWLLGGVFAAFLLVVLGYVMFIGPQRSQTNEVNAQVSAAEQANAALRVRIESLRQESRNIATYRAQVTQAQLALPSTSGLPAFLRTLQSIGNATQADVSALTVGPPTDLSLAAAAPAGSAPSATKSHGLRVYSLPITATVSGTTAQLDRFLTQLQTVQPRAVLITQLTETAAASGDRPGAKAGNTATLQLTMAAFVAPTGRAEQAQLSAAAGK